MIGIWDDHDYGTNNGDGTFKYKDQVRDIFLDYIEEPLNTERRKEKHTGIFQDYIIQKNDIKVHVILPDLRYNYNKTSNERFGEYQRQFLRDCFKKHKDSNLTVLVGSVQIIPDRVSFVEELNWENKEFLFELVKENQRSRVIFLSGDIHSA